MLKIDKGSSCVLMGVVLEDDHRIETPDLDLTAKSPEVEGALTYRLMKVPVTVVVVKMKFDKTVRKSVQPLGQWDPRKDEKMAYIETKSKVFAEFFPQSGKVVGTCVEYIFEADAGLDPARRFEEFTPHPEAVLEPQLLTEGKTELVETRVKHDLPWSDLFRQIHDLGEAQSGYFQDPGIEPPGREIRKGGMKCHPLAIFTPFDHGGDVILGQGIEEFSRQVDLGKKTDAVQKIKVPVKLLQACLAVEGKAGHGLPVTASSFSRSAPPPRITRVSPALISVLKGGLKSMEPVALFMARIIML